jgi:hypothetical protein
MDRDGLTVNVLSNLVLLGPGLALTNLVASGLKARKRDSEIRREVWSVCLGHQQVGRLIGCFLTELGVDPSVIPAPPLHQQFDPRERDAIRQVSLYLLEVKMLAFSFKPESDEEPMHPGEHWHALTAGRDIMHNLFTYPLLPLRRLCELHRVDAELALVDRSRVRSHSRLHQYGVDLSFDQVMEHSLAPALKQTTAIAALVLLLIWEVDVLLALALDVDMS